MKVAQPNLPLFKMGRIVFIPYQNHTKYNTFCKGMVLISQPIENMYIDIVWYFLDTMFLNVNKKYKNSSLRKSPWGLKS